MGLRHRKGGLNTQSGRLPAALKVFLLDGVEAIYHSSQSFSDTSSSQRVLQTLKALACRAVAVLLYFSVFLRVAAKNHPRVNKIKASINKKIRSGVSTFGFGLKIFQSLFEGVLVGRQLTIMIRGLLQI